MKSTTFGIAAYNSSETISTAVESITKIYPKSPIIIVDDCSTDTTWSVIQGLAEANPRIRVFRNDVNLGVAGARNRIVSLVESEFFAFLDADDKCLPGRLEAQVARLLEAEKSLGHRSILCFTGRQQVGNGAGGYVPCMGDGDPLPTGEVVADFILLHRKGHPKLASTGAGSMLARPQTIVEAGLFDLAFRRAEELDLVVRLALVGGAFVGVQEPLVEQLVTSGSHKTYKRVVENYMRLLRKHRPYLQRKRAYWYGVVRTRKALAYNAGRKLPYIAFAVASKLLAPLVRW